MFEKSLESLQNNLSDYIDKKVDSRKLPPKVEEFARNKQQELLENDREKRRQRGERKKQKLTKEKMKKQEDAMKKEQKGREAPSKDEKVCPSPPQLVRDSHEIRSIYHGALENARHVDETNAPDIHSQHGSIHHSRHGSVRSNKSKISSKQSSNRHSPSDRSLHDHRGGSRRSAKSEVISKESSRSWGCSNQRWSHREATPPLKPHSNYHTPTTDSAATTMGHFIDSDDQNAEPKCLSPPHQSSHPEIEPVARLPPGRVSRRTGSVATTYSQFLASARRNAESTNSSHRSSVSNRTPSIVSKSDERPGASRSHHAHNSHETRITAGSTSNPVHTAVGRIEGSTREETGPNPISRQLAAANHVSVASEYTMDRSQTQTIQTPRAGHHFPEAASVYSKGQRKESKLNVSDTMKRQIAKHAACTNESSQHLPSGLAEAYHSDTSGPTTNASHHLTVERSHPTARAPCSVNPTSDLINTYRSQPSRNPNPNRSTTNTSTISPFPISPLTPLADCDRSRPILLPIPPPIPPKHAGRAVHKPAARSRGQPPTAFDTQNQEFRLNRREIARHLAPSETSLVRSISTRRSRGGREAESVYTLDWDRTG